MSFTLGIMNRIVSFLVLLIVSFFSSLGYAQTAGIVPQSQGQIQLSFAPLVKRAAPAVVNIYARKIVKQQRRSLFNDPFFQQFFANQFGGLGRSSQRIQNSLGSGVIVNEKGLIITNNHVINGADEIKVVLTDRREFDAKLLASDKKTDIAILKIDSKGSGLPFLELRDSDELQIGDLVLAIGNPFGVGQTVTSGIVSAMARTQIGSSDLNFFIQTDAAINPGNSGGALVSMDGKLVGINTMIFSKSGGSQGIGFAIPSTMVRAVIKGINSDGKLVRSWLGATGQAVSQDIATNLGLSRPLGLLINRLHQEGSAQKAGVKIGDIILAVNGYEINDQNGLRFRIATHAPGESVTLHILRKGKQKKLQVKLTSSPEIPKRQLTLLEGKNPLSGSVIANFSRKSVV